MTKFAIGQTVTLVKYEPGPNNAPGKAVEYQATVIGVERVNNAEVPHLHLAFLHPGRMMVLASANWRDAFDRVFSVPHEDDVKNQAFYYRDDFSDLRNANEDLRDMNAGLEMQLAATTEGKDASLQAEADKRVRIIGDPSTYGVARDESALPSSADLDAVDEEEKAKAATAPQS